MRLKVKALILTRRVQAVPLILFKQWQICTIHQQRQTLQIHHHTRHRIITSIYYNILTLRKCVNRRLQYCQTKATVASIVFLNCRPRYWMPNLRTEIYDIQANLCLFLQTTQELKRSDFNQMIDPIIKNFFNDLINKKCVSPIKN